jgi:hypothetical protein
VRRLRRCAAAVVLAAGSCFAAAPFWVRIVDDQTARGVPLVELRTPNAVSYWTDSNGVAVIDDAAFEGRDVAFLIHSDGYEFPKDKLLNHSGRILHVESGQHVELRIHRINIAERLYRITGADIDRDSVLAGLKSPITHPILDAGVLGQDTNISIPYEGKIFWCWGDTIGPANFNGSVTCATSDLPSLGGLDPSVGVNLTYFTNSSGGFTRPMLLLGRPGLVWIEGLFTVKDPAGRERLVATYTRQPSLAPPTERGIAVFDDTQNQFRVLAEFPARRGHQSSHPFPVTVAGVAYWYLYPHLRVRNQWNAITNPKSYESYTCLQTGARFDTRNPRLDRDASGKPKWGWKADTDRIDARAERDLISRGYLKKDDAYFSLVDVDSGAPSGASPSSVAWNAWRKKWIMFAEKTGDVYYSEADEPTGPWRWAKKIVTHNAYNFYNVVQHSFFDQEGGRVIYFEGTYTSSFSNARQDTPRYNYNQIMYRLRLDNPRLRSLESRK